MSLARSFPSPDELPAESGTTPRLFQFKPENDEAGRIYEALADHQSREDDWKYRSFIAKLQQWAGIFDATFDLKVPEVSLGIDRLRPNRLGHFCRGHNAFGLKGEIKLNSRHLIDMRAPWEVLGTLLHELLHGWQQAYGKAGKWNYHNVQYCAKAREYGLLVNHRGETHYDPEGRFFQVLREHGMDLPDLRTEAPVTVGRERGESKLKKWSCGCTNARVAVSDFRARCLRCGREFLRCD